MTNLINEAGNQSTNHTKCDLTVRRGIGYSGPVNACSGGMWVLGRFFCSTALIRPLEEFGKV